MNEPIRVSFMEGWTVDVRREWEHVALDWYATGSQHASLTQLEPFEARKLAIALLQVAEEAENGNLAGSD